MEKTPHHMSTYYNGHKGHVSDAGVNDSEQHVYEITNVQNQTNAQILSTAQLHAALDPHPLHGLQLLSEAHGTETVAVVPDNPNGTGTAKLTAIVAGTPQSRTVTWDEVILHTTTKNLTFFQNETSALEAEMPVSARGGIAGTGSQPVQVLDPFLNNQGAHGHSWGRFGFR